MRIHFISIGGSVMHQLAIALHKKGYIVTGSDDDIFEPSRTNLANEGLLPASIGWNADHITADLDAVLLGMHARADNPELEKARALGLPVYSFPEYIYQESLDKTRVVVGGSHGKTTTTSMIMHVLKESGLAFDFLVGARLPGFAQSVQVSHAPVIVCEGDEYPASALEKRPKFHFLHPHIAVLTGIAWDHINVFPTFDNYLEQFRIFLDNLEPGATLIYNDTDEVLRALVTAHTRADIKRVPYGIPPHRVEETTTVLVMGQYEAPLQVFGTHNLLNLHAAWLVAEALGVTAEQFCNAISGFTGAAKRLEVVAENEGRVVFRDFAHAPSKVKATMEAVRHQFSERRVAAVLELHTYSSLSVGFMPHYAGALDAAHAACVFYSPHAMEIKRMPPLPPEAIAEGFGKKDLAVITGREALEAWIAAQKNTADNLLLMSSGTYDGMDVQAIAADWITPNPS